MIERAQIDRGLPAVIGLLAGAAVITLAAPTAVLAHSLNATYASRLPLPVYLAGAGATVALSFIFVLVRDVRAERSDTPRGGRLPPAWLRLALRGLGLIAWLWILAQGIAGGSSAADVATLFLWVYGWVGVAALSALVGPVWHFLDPFSTLFDIGAWVVRKAGIQTWDLATYPGRLGKWPAVIGFAVVVWLELVLRAGPDVLFIVVVGYTALTLAMMAQYGRDTWRANADVFTVWFRLLGRLAPYALVDEDGRVRRRPFFGGLLERGWSLADVVLVALGVGSILYDGLSQTQVWFSTFGLPSLAGQTLLFSSFLGLITVAALAITRSVGVAATGAGLLPIALGYLIAHYFTYLVIDGQRILVAISDPLQTGADLFGTAFHEPSGAGLPPGLVWTLQLASVVGGHMLGAWAGHVVASLDAPRELAGRPLAVRQVPLAVVMVALTTLTLWSLGQAIVVNPDDGGGSAAGIDDGSSVAGHARITVRRVAGRVGSTALNQAISASWIPAGTPDPSPK